VIIDALKTKYSLPRLLEKLNLSKAVITIKKKFCLNRTNIFPYGYASRNYSLKIKTDMVTAECMHCSNVKTSLFPRRLSAEKPNSKWLTDITEFAVPAGKIYLSLIMDCFDGLLVAWKIGSSIDSTLVNTMLDDAIRQLSPEEKPIVHSDRGVHYRWSGWIERMDKAGLTRSMSEKGCSPDNSACERVFGRVKNEMFYNTDWAGINISDFLAISVTKEIYQNISFS
jgi:putative transposase